MPYQVVNVAKDEESRNCPNFNEVAGVVIMGGPMGALDIRRSIPGLKAEAKLARAAVSSRQAGAGRVSRAIRSLPPRWARNSRRAASRKSDSRRLNASTSTTTSPCGTRPSDVLHWHNDVVTRCRKAHSRWHKSAEDEEPGVPVRFGAWPAIPPGGHPHVVGRVAGRAVHGEGFEGRRRFEIADYVTPSPNTIRSCSRWPIRFSPDSRPGAAPMPQRWSADKRSARYTPH